MTVETVQVEAALRGLCCTGILSNGVPTLAKLDSMVHSGGAAQMSLEISVMISSSGPYTGGWRLPLTEKVSNVYWIDSVL